MKKSLKIILLVLFVFMAFAISNKVEANSINKISMDIFVDDNGNALVTEIWNCNATEGTEVYHPYYNLGNSEILNLTVSEGTTNYETLSSWDTSGSLNSKAHKCGINKISNGVELCWGISSYGSHTYTVKYKIINFVSELSDSQMIYWTLIPYEFSNPIGNVNIKIHTNFNIANSIPVWGYGNTGTCYVYNGSIEMNSEGSLTDSDYMTILAKFPLKTFTLSNRLDHDFDYYYKESIKGVKQNKFLNFIKSDKFIIYSILSIAFIFLIFKIISFIKNLNIGFRRKTSNSSKKLEDFAKAHNINLNKPYVEDDIIYFRDIPCNKDIFRAYYVCYTKKINKRKSDFIGTVILKWIRDSIIRIEKDKEKEKDVVIILNNSEQKNIKNLKERELFSMIYNASKDGILENKEFKKWYEKNTEYLLKWFNRIIEEEKRKLLKDGISSDHELEKEANELKGLKKYLQDYSLIKEREAIEVQILEEYLMYAQMFGIAKEVAKQFKDLYPEIMETSQSLLSYDEVLFISENILNDKLDEEDLEEDSDERISNFEKARRYSEGGEGFSSSEGGDSSFGGGEGRRRIQITV